MASLSDFDIMVMVALQNEFGSFPSSASFWKSLSRKGVSSFLGVVVHIHNGVFPSWFKL